MRRHRGERHPDFANSINSVALVYQEFGNYTAALPLLRQSLEINGATLGEAHRQFAAALGNLAKLHRHMGDYAAALPPVDKGPG